MKLAADFIPRRVSSIEEVLTDTPAPGLRLISGAGDLLSAANIKHLQKVRVMNHVRAIVVDVVLIDLGAGTSYNILDFFLLSDVSILAVVPEPTSIENGYRFIKSALYRRLRAAAPTESVKELVEAALDPKNPQGIKTPVDLLARVEAEDAEAGEALRREIGGFAPRFVVNEVRDVSDVGMSATIEEMLMASEYILSGGYSRVILCERGIRTFETATRNTTDINAMPVLKKLTHLPVILDPSHSTGDSAFVASIAKAGIAAGADGIIVEVHQDPAHAISDGKQSLTPEAFARMVKQVKAVAEAVDRRLVSPLPVGVPYGDDKG